MSNTAESVLKNMQSVRDSLTRLDEIALKPRVFTDAQYFEQMIDHEKNTKEPGFESRVKGLEMLQDRALQIQKLHSATNVKDIVQEYKKVIAEATERIKKQKGGATRTKAAENCTVM